MLIIKVSILKGKKTFKKMWFILRTDHESQTWKETYNIPGQIPDDQTVSREPARAIDNWLSVKRLCGVHRVLV